jgi:DNA-binding NarL/FixJ family response regulator
MKILMLTMHKDKEHFYQSMSAGADGYLVKNEPETELFAAIGKIRQGKKYVSPSMSEELAGALDQVWEAFQKPILTIREIEVLKLIAEGKLNKEIGVLLSISVHTVENHRANIMNKLSLRSAAVLTRYAIEKGYL